MSNRKLLRPEDRLGFVTARRASWPAELIETHKKCVGHDEFSDAGKRRGDVLLIQSAVQNYIQTLALEDEVDTKRIKETIWSTRDTVNIKHFKLAK